MKKGGKKRGKTFEERKDAREGTERGKEKGERERGKPISMTIPIKPKSSFATCRANNCNKPI